MLFSGHGTSVGSVVLNRHVFAMQVRTRFLPYTKKTDELCLIVFPCPRVLCKSLLECYAMAILLLCAGDIESNPGPNTRTVALSELDDLPDDSADQMKIMFKLLKDVHSRSLQSSKCPTELVSDVKAIKNGQKNIQTELAGIKKRLDDLEEKSKSLDRFDTNLTRMQDNVDSLAAQNSSLLSRLDDLEDRSRRDNLIFHGLPDSKETWQQTEEKLTSVLNAALGSFPSSSIQRAHRLGTYQANKCRPIIAKFTNYKAKESVLSSRAQLRSSNIAVNEDFSPATRLARKKLIEFAKSQPDSPQFKLSHKKLLLNNKCYMYHSNSNSIQEMPRRNFGLNHVSAASQHVPT
ncbi:uncharacterized protein [Dermacentor andersoni]|uniref:uncharacterized protein n=1 Tax=Dermacentor andersoni TaxID=34620 RepID=UPI002155DCDB